MLQPDQLISVVVPVYNERDNVGPLTDELIPVLRELPQRSEVIFVDDGSRDGTAAILDRIAVEVPEVSVVRLRRNFGKAEALMAGFTVAEGEVLITIDGDLQDDPRRSRDARRARQGIRLGIRVEAQPAGPGVQAPAVEDLNGVTRRVSGVPLHDLNCGFKVYRSEVVDALALAGDQYRYIPVLAVQEGFSVGELPVNHRPREHGSTKYGFERYLRGFLDLLTITFLGRYRQRPMHLFGGLGVAAVLLGVLISAYLTVLKLLGHSIGNRPLLLLGVLLILVGMQFLTIGLVSEMIQRHHLRPRSEEAASRVKEIIGRPTDRVA